jgi:hypothetical protein
MTLGQCRIGFTSIRNVSQPGAYTGLLPKVEFVQNLSARVIELISADAAEKATGIEGQEELLAGQID